MSPRTSCLPVRPRFSTILCQFAHKIFFLRVSPPGGYHPGRFGPLVTPLVVLSYIANPCRRLRRPLNGVLMCSSTSSGGGTELAHDTVCKLFCHRGFVPARSADVQIQTAESFHCDRTGTWQPTEHVPSCVSKYTKLKSFAVAYAGLCYVGQHCQAVLPIFKCNI